MRFYYLVSVYLIRILFRILFGYKIEGLENWERGDGFLIASNHHSYLDPILVGVVAPIEICYLAKQEIFGWPVLGYLASKYNAFPTTRRGFDLEVFRTVKRLFRKKKPLLIFIEGTRSRDGDLLPAKKGVGLISF